MDEKEKQLAEARGTCAHLEERLSIWRDTVIEDLERFEKGSRTFKDEKELEVLQGYLSRILLIVETVSRKAETVISTVQLRKQILQLAKGAR